MPDYLSSARRHPMTRRRLVDVLVGYQGHANDGFTLPKLIEADVVAWVREQPEEPYLHLFAGALGSMARRAFELNVETGIFDVTDLFVGVGALLKDRRDPYGILGNPNDFHFLQRKRTR